MRKIVPSSAVLIPDDAKRVFTGVIYNVYHWQQAMFDGSKKTFEMLKRPDTVQVIGVVDDKIVILDDEQPHSGAKLSLPGGRVDAEDVSTLAAAQRELHEEAGYAFKQWRLILVQQNHAKIEQFVYYYLAWDLAEKTAPHVDLGGEKITAQLVTFARLKQLSQERVGYLGEAWAFLEKCADLQELLALPEFTGKTIER